MEKNKVFNLGPINQVLPGLGKSFVVQGEQIAVFRGRDGRLFAIQNICPHKQMPLADGVMGDGIVICPGHGHKFNLTTGQGSEAGESVETFEVLEKDGEIFLVYHDET